MKAAPSAVPAPSKKAALPATLGALRAAGYRSRSVKDELRTNVARKLKSGERLFPGVMGYEETVTPQLANALLARHDFILLGLRGQAKSKILRLLPRLLDERVPAIAGSEVNDDPLAPISKHGRQMVAEHGDDTPIEWLTPEQRYVEKLATPDVTIADLIGDLDPIKAARSGRDLADELTIHYGMLPRANRGIFAVNELPDLSPRLQVGLFNVLEEGDIQIKGYPVRMPLDLLLAFTANPEDYTARGKIVTPLKDRIAAEIRTHYPIDRATGMSITRQAAWARRGLLPLEMPLFVRQLVEDIAMLARYAKGVDQRSGVSQRMPIALCETVISSAEQRAIIQGEAVAVPRICDIYAALPAITGKLELEYEGEVRGAESVARNIILESALGAYFEHHESVGMEPEHDEIVQYFEAGGVMQVSVLATGAACVAGFRQIPGLLKLARDLELAPEGSSNGVIAAACELILEGLVGDEAISRTRSGGYARVRD